VAWSCEESFEKALERLEWEGRRLQAGNLAWEHARVPERARKDASSRAERAFSFVYIASVLEDLFRTLSLELASDLKSLTLNRYDLRPEALSLLLPDVWSGVSGDRVARIAKRREIISEANDFYITPGPIDLLSIGQLSLHDGRTVDTVHFEAIWAGLCLAPPPEMVWPSDQHRRAVATIAQKRNVIAHHETDPREEAFRFSYKDLHERCLHVTETVERLQEHVVAWLDRHRTP